MLNSVPEVYGYTLTIFLFADTGSAFNSTNTTHKFSGLEGGSDYDFKVRAHIRDGASVDVSRIFTTGQYQKMEVVLYCILSKEMKYDSAYAWNFVKTRLIRAIYEHTSETNYIKYIC